MSDSRPYTRPLRVPQNEALRQAAESGRSPIVRVSETSYMWLIEQGVKRETNQAHVLGWAVHNLLIKPELVPDDLDVVLHERTDGPYQLNRAFQLERVQFDNLAGLAETKYTTPSHLAEYAVGASMINPSFPGLGREL